MTATNAWFRNENLGSDGDGIVGVADAADEVHAAAVISGTAQSVRPCLRAMGHGADRQLPTPVIGSAATPATTAAQTGVVSQTYLVSGADVGDTLEVAVTATNTAGFATEARLRRRR